MAWEVPVLDLPGQIAGEDFSSVGALTGLNSTGQFLFVKMAPGINDTVLHCSSAKDRPVGVSQGNSVKGDALQVRAIGVSKIVAGAAVAAGDPVGTDAAGRCVKKAETATGANYGEFVAGLVLEGVVAAGSVATVLLQSPYRI